MAIETPLTLSRIFRGDFTVCKWVQPLRLIVCTHANIQAGIDELAFRSLCAMN